MALASFGRQGLILSLRRSLCSLESVPALLRNQFRSASYRNIRCLCYNSKDSDGGKFGDSKDSPKSKSDQIDRAVPSKYQPFKDEDAPIIFDVEEERLMSFTDTQDAPIGEFAEINLERGERGVFDIDDLLKVLQRENAQDTVVIEIPQSFAYVDHMVIVSSKSTRHMHSMAEFVRRVFKKKCHPTDAIPVLEGKNSKDWVALDMGNIALHIFSREARKIYDLESLWALGHEYEGTGKPPEDDFESLLKKHSVYLGDLHPAEKAG